MGGLLCIEEKRSEKITGHPLEGGTLTGILWRESREKIIYGEKTYMKPSTERITFNKPSLEREDLKQKTLKKVSYRENSVFGLSWRKTFNWSSGEITGLLRREYLFKDI